MEVGYRGTLHEWTSLVTGGGTWWLDWSLHGGTSPMTGLDHLICSCRQLSKVNIIWHETSGQWNEVLSGIVDDTRGVEYTL